MIKKLRIKFVIINMTMVTAMLLAIFMLIFYFTRENLEDKSISMMEAIAADPFSLGAPNERPSDPRLPYFILQTGPMGELVSTGGGYYDLSNMEFLNDLAMQSINSVKAVGVLPEQALRYYRMDTARGKLLVFADMSSELDTLDTLVKNSVIIGLFSFSVFLMISIFLSRWAVRPVEAAWNQQKQFVADASHELKTPLTVIMTNAELMQSGEYDAESMSRFSQGILTMSRQMRSLVERLLELARSENQQGLAMERVDMSALVTEAALSFEGIFMERGLTLSCDVEKDIRVRGNRDALRQVLDILLDNGGKYCLPGGNISLSLRRAGRGRVRLEAANPGRDMDERELESVFRRFYRGDAARSRDGSFGLGLAIARSLVAEHNGRIWAKSSDGIITFTVELKRLC